jgi:hypothetical protein
MKSPYDVSLHNAVTVSQQHLGKRVAPLSAARMNEVCAALGFLWGVMQTSYWERSACPRISVPRFPSGFPSGNFRSVDGRCISVVS